MDSRHQILCSGFALRFDVGAGGDSTFKAHKVSKEGSIPSLYNSSSYALASTMTIMTHKLQRLTCSVNGWWAVLIKRPIDPMMNQSRSSFQLSSSTHSRYWGPWAVQAYVSRKGREHG